MPRNSTLDVEECEENGRVTSGSKRAVITKEGESWIGEDGSMGEDMGDTGSYLKGERNLSSDICEEIWGEKGGGKTEERFDNDCVTSLI